MDSGLRPSKSVMPTWMASPGMTARVRSPLLHLRQHRHRALFSRARKRSTLTPASAALLLFAKDRIDLMSQHPHPALAQKRTALALAAPILAALLLAPAGAAREDAVLTPLIFAVETGPVPFRGSDGLTHLAYEIFITNFSSGPAAVDNVEILSGDTVLARLDAAAVASRLQPVAQREPTATLPASTQALLYLHVALPPDALVPQKLARPLLPMRVDGQRRVDLATDLAGPPLGFEMVQTSLSFLPVRAVQ